MKIKLDFITNSSSTCFVIILKKGQKFTKEQFMNCVGIQKNSPVYEIFEQMFDIFSNKKRPFDKAVNKHRWNKEKKWNNFIKSIFSDDLVERIKLAKRTGDNIYFGTLASDEGELEAFFCCDSFTIEGENIFIDATNSRW